MQWDKLGISGDGRRAALIKNSVNNTREETGKTIHKHWGLDNAIIFKISTEQLWDPIYSSQILCIGTAWSPWCHDSRTVMPTDGSETWLTPVPGRGLMTFMQTPMSNSDVMGKR